ncbi:protein of unknown function [Halogranum amylolyticum]|uniref:DUF4349 domain-containing protein n=1 Tax=Halogranum amylolyticum TaxID=660520 RepID=A0A1H8U1W0_9EURY|nr:DUF4349 domain-containing protein [Halogranum amylolyticum]SEO96638.1 protein of unknown function [Halogranum amylolyticum]
MRRRPRLFVTVLLALLVVLAGCSGAGDSAAGGNDAGGEATNLDQSTPAASSGGDGGSADEAAQSGDAESASSTQFAARRELIRTGEVRLLVDDFASAERNLTAAVEARGGYVSDTSQQVRGRENETWTTGTVVLRVPKENFSALLDDVRAEGEVQQSKTATEDVTEQVVDLEARLENLRAERDRLRTLYESANETEDVLRVGQELSETQEEIERTEARLRALEGRIAYSTLTVELSEPRPEYEQIRRAAWYDTSAVTAFLDSVDGVIVVLRAAFVGAAYAAPYVLVFGLPLVGAALFVRRRRWLRRLR